MRDTIYTIPISEVFEPKEGCPLCRMRDRLEERSVEYVMGAAMMEPDVRQETNRAGFCPDHFRMMLARKNRLSVGLMLQSHLDYIATEIVGAKTSPFGKDRRAALAAEIGGGCFVCARIETSMRRMVSNTLGVWQKEAAFRALFAEQEYICFAHYGTLLAAAQEGLPKKLVPDFAAQLGALTMKKLTALKADIDAFCNLFDYRRGGVGPVPDDVRDSPERAARFLTARDVAP